VVLVEPSRIRLAPTGALRITPRESLDPFRPIAEVAAAEGAETLAEGTAAAALSARAADRGALWSAAQMLGMGQRCIDLAAAFVQGRHQFGRPVGSFQAVKHHLASAQVRVELARPVLAAASAQSPGAGPATAARIAHAKLACGTAAEAAACAAIQVHGAMGYSWEVDLHFHLKRILALSAAWGTPAELRATVATRIFAAPPGPETLFPEEDARG
jgi:alkylation response protein AidB-like acyl-CoA dehydrogenase